MFFLDACFSNGLSAAMSAFFKLRYSVSPFVSGGPINMANLPVQGCQAQIGCNLTPNFSRSRKALPLCLQRLTKQQKLLCSCVVDIYLTPATVTQRNRIRMSFAHTSFTLPFIQSKSLDCTYRGRSPMSRPPPSDMITQ